MLLLIFSVLLPVLLEKSSVSNQYWLFSLDMRPKQWKIKTFTFTRKCLGNQALVYVCFSVDLQKPSECGHGQVRPSKIILSKLSS